MSDDDQKLSPLDDLTANANRIKVNKSYSIFVRFMRFVLPVVALSIAVIVFTWPEMENNVIQTANKEDLVTQAANIKNELLEPRFESTNNQNQPFTITATRAMQGQDSAELVFLEQPQADMKLKSGETVSIEAEKGIYEQQTEKLFLENSVTLTHESGYALETDELRVDLKTRQAFSAKPVKAHGPKSELQATGLEANQGAGKLIFTGPAQLILHDGMNFSFGKAMP